MGAPRGAEVTAVRSVGSRTAPVIEGPEGGRQLDARQLSDAILGWTLGHVPQGVFTTDSELRINSWNHWLETHSSLQREQVIGRPVAEIVPSLAERRLDEYFHGALRGEVKVLSRALHGFLIPLPSVLPEAGFPSMQQNARIAPLIFDGAICGTITTIEDVTEREWQSTRLRAERERGELLSETLVHLLGTHNPNAIVPYIFAKVSRVLGIDCYLEYRPDLRPLKLRLRSSGGLTPEQQAAAETVTSGEGACGQCVSEREPVLLNNILSSDDPLAAKLRSLGFHSQVALPLAIGSRVLGCVAFASRARASFSPEDVLFLQTCCQYATVALDRLERESELRASEERFRAMADTVPDIIFTARSGGSFDFINQRFETLTGVAPAAAIGFGWLGAVHAGEVKAVRDQWRAAVLEGKPLNAELRLRSPDGRYRWFVARAHPIRNEKGEITKWFGAITEIDDLKQTELALASAQGQLAEHAEKLEITVEERTAKLRETIMQLESFSYTVAHDLRAPIRAMEGYANVLLEDYGDRLDAEGREVLSNIARASNRLDALTRDVLSYTRISTREIELATVDLDRVVQDVLVMNPSLQAPAARIQIVRPLHRVIAQPTLLAQALSNLLDNAVKFVAVGVTPQITVRSEVVQRLEGGTERSSLETGLPRADSMKSTPAGPADRVRLWIEDNGIGMDEASLSNVFHIFQRGREAKHYPGTGIGLAIVAKSISRMGGRYGVYSSPGQGSRFWIELPYAKASAGME